MNKKILSFIILLIYTLFSITPSVFADGDLMYSKEIRAQIIDNFKSDQYDYIFSNDDNILLKDESLDFLQTNNKIDFYEKLKEASAEKTDELTLKSKFISLRYDNLQEAISELDSQIEQANNDIISLDNDIDNLTQEIVDKKAEIVDLQNEINESSKILLDYIAYIYKQSNIVEGDEDIDSIKTILMSGDNLNQVLSDMYYSSLIEVTGQNLIETHRTLVKKAFLTRINLESTQKKLEEEKESQIEAKKEIQEKRLFREKLLTYTEGQQEKYDQYISDQEEIQTNLRLKILQSQIKIQIQKNNLLKEYNCKSLSSSDFDNIGDLEISTDDLLTYSGGELTIDEDELRCYNLNRVLENELKLQSNISSKEELEDNPLLWPVNPENGLSAYYKDPEYTDIVGADHDAIDIRTAQGTDIVAPADGYVTFLNPPDDEGYAYVALKHANGFVTVYGHINELYVNKFDYVKAGEVFAKSGGEFGTNGAGTMTTGPHLHFEVFKDKESVDPLYYLDLTELGESNIPIVQSYVYKYLDDYREKFGEQYSGELTSKVKIFTLEGETETDRQKDLLNKYASSSFNNWDIWVEESVYGGIDPSFLMCIGLAETGLGRHLKTGYNVGNIGNTDSGDTVIYPNARSGIYWMVKTLNNRFLGSYQTMDQLSRYGNKDKPIYASSPVNWHTNIKRCLTALKQETIQDDFEFRIKTEE